MTTYTAREGQQMTRTLQSTPETPQKPGKRKRAPLERQTQKAICDWLALAGLPHSITDASRAFGPDGRPRRSKVATSWPDITACGPDGRLVAIECKRDGEKPTPGQSAMLLRLAEAGAVALLAYSVENVVDGLASAYCNELDLEPKAAQRLWRAVWAYREGHGAK